MDDDHGVDRSLLDAAAEAVVVRNRAHAAQLEAMSVFHARRVAEVEARAAGVGSDLPAYFALTPLQATRVEFAPLLGISEVWVQADLDLTDDLKRWFPRMWERCLSGRLDIGRAQVVHAQLANLTCDEDKAAYAELICDWMDRHDDPAAAVYPVRRQLLQRAARRVCLKFPQRSEQEAHAEAFKKRRVSLHIDENGMARIAATTAVHDALRADYRLTLIAKRRRECEGEERTLEQLRTDTMYDLLLGRITVTAPDSRLEDPDDDGEGGGDLVRHHGSTGRWARPIINVTVPVTTLMGFGDEPGVMAGGTRIPADLARQIAAEPGSTWHRMLTDPARGFVELSTDSYTPTAPIEREVVARDPECVFPGCVRPATACECDHRTPHPLGPTSTGNLQPLCRRHHLVKHSEGFSVVREDDGSYTWSTRFGTSLRTAPPEYPSAEWPADLGEMPWPEQFDQDGEGDIPDHIRDAMIDLARECHDLELAIAG